MEPLSFYCAQSTMSDPGLYAYLFDTLPDDLSSLCHAIQGVYIHYYVARDPDSGVPQEHIADVDLRYVDSILARIVALSDRPLTERRPHDKRFVGCCRDASLLLCSMLRHKGIPARIRVGFALYINTGTPGFYPDHVVTEYWNDGSNSWKLVDPEQNDWLIKHNRIDFDVQNIPHDKFLVAGAAWQLIESGKVEAANFGEPGDLFRGVWAVRDRIFHDLAALNKVEPLLWDSWSPLMAFEANPTPDEQELLNHVISATTANPPDFETVTTLYQDTRLTTPTHVTTFSPVVLPHEVDIRI